MLSYGHMLMTLCKFIFLVRPRDSWSPLLWVCEFPPALWDQCWIFSIPPLPRPSNEGPPITPPQKKPHSAIGLCILHWRILGQMKRKKYKQIPCAWYVPSLPVDTDCDWLTAILSPILTEQGYLNMTFLKLFKELINSFVG